MTDIPSFTDHTSPDKRELLAMLLKEADEEFTPFPLSFAQQRLWFLHQLEPDSPLYNMPIAVRLQGTLSREALTDSLDAIVERHESLRTTFTVVDEQPIQLIAAQGRITIREIDLSYLQGEQQAAETSRLVTEEARQPFKLAQGPLLRALLLRLSQQEHVLLLTLHHIIADGWSLGVLVQEVAAFYQASLTGQLPNLPELEIQYADFAQWQRDELSGEFLEEQLAYWKQQLGGDVPALDLPTDHSRPASPTFRGALHSFTLSRALSDSLKALCRQEGATTFMALLAAFKTALYRYTEQTDIAVGTPIAGRNQEAIEPLIGFFANTLVLRTDVSNNPSFRELLGRVRNVTLGAYEHQDIPFEMLVEALQPRRSLSHNPLFQVMLVLQNAPMPALRLANLTLSTFDIDSGTAKFDMLLAFHETEDGLHGTIEYSTELFEAATIERLAGHLSTLLSAAVADPDRRLADLPLLTTAEQQTLRSWNATEAQDARAQYLHQLFTEQAARTPDAVAVTFIAADEPGAAQTLTYRELDERSNQLAHYLRGLGIGPDMPVGICMERSIDRMVALLGALKAGGAYLPLDPANPEERLALVLRDSEAALVLTHSALRDRLPAEATRVLCLDQSWAAIADYPTHAPEIALAPTNLAYIIYTSGSTGQPKGVSIDHRPLTNLVAWQLESGLAPGALRTLQFAAPTFDVSLQEIFTSWATGSALFLTNADIQRDAEQLLDFLADHRIERLFMPFVALQQLAEVAHERAALPTDLREIITAGEQLQITPRIVELFQRLAGCRLYNHYGPTESHVVTAFTLEDVPQSWSALPPIGYPIANTQIYLLDRELRQVPIGVPGELYIGGDGLARGYLNRSALTAEKFVPDPLTAVPGARLYKTGDLARYRPNGAIEFLGRRDHQVKLRGFRVELGEIEAALRQHEAIREMVVVVREDEPGLRRLVAYVVGENQEPRTQNLGVEPETPPSPIADEAEARRGVGQGPGVKASTEDLRSFLASRLPEYMIPSAFVWLDALPLTRHGKVDRR
ncbi:MAG TPA: amino acid adenylation domain-containing protein, partial [Herpetosiphonaceae bacterium]